MPCGLWTPCGEAACRAVRGPGWDTGPPASPVIGVESPAFRSSAPVSATVIVTAVPARLGWYGLGRLEQRLWWGRL